MILEGWVFLMSEVPLYENQFSDTWEAGTQICGHVRPGRGHVPFFFITLGLELSDTKSLRALESSRC